MVLAAPAGNYISSIILPKELWLIDYQIRNYVPIFLLSTSFYLILLVYIYFSLGEIKEKSNPKDSIAKRASLRASFLEPIDTQYLTPKFKNTNSNNIDLATYRTNKAFEKDSNDDIDNVDLNIDRNNNIGDSKESRIRFSLTDDPLPVRSINEKPTIGEMFRNLFQLENAFSMVKSVIKKREEKAHILLWLTMIIYPMLIICSRGLSFIMLSFVQTVYGWNASNLMVIDSITGILWGIVSTIVLITLNKYEFEDTTTMLIGLIGLSTSNILIGAILTPLGTYLSLILGSVFLCGLVSCRGLVSKIIPEDEIGRFSLYF